MKRYNEAANAYGRAIALGEAQGRKTDLWTMLLLQASALQEANRWPETKQALEKGLALAPDQPLLLNFLGYAKLEKGEDVDSAEAMIRKASGLRPRMPRSSIRSAGRSSSAARSRTRSRRSSSGGKGPGPGRDPGASRRCALHVGAALRGALRVERGAGDRGGRYRRPGEGQARFRADHGQRGALIPAREIAPAKLNLALHVRGKRGDGRHEIETVFAFCIDGDGLSAEKARRTYRSRSAGPFAADLGDDGDNLVLRAARALARAARIERAQRSGSTSGCRLLRGSAADRPMRRRR